MDDQTFVTSAARHGIDPEAARSLYDELRTEAPPARSEPAALLSRPESSFEDESTLTRAVQTMIWLGVVLVIGAHVWWCVAAYPDLGIGVVFALTVTWQAGFVCAAEWARRRDLGTLEAGFAGIVAFYTPLTVYSLEQGLFGFGRLSFGDFSVWAHPGGLLIELASVAVAALLFERYRRPFVMLPLTVFACSLGMDGLTRIVGGGWHDDPAVGLSLLVSGLATMAVGVGLDYRGLRRFALWPHVVGMSLLAWSFFWFCDGPVALLLSSIVAFGLGVWLARTTYLAAGAFFGWAALTATSDGALVPFLLLVGGLGVIVGAILLAHSNSPLRRWLDERGLPAPQRDLAY